MEKQTKIAMITMFKNESSVILRMLESCYKYIDYYVMQDNGSNNEARTTNCYLRKKKVH